MKLKAKTFSKKLKAEIVAAFPDAVRFTKRHVPGVGYVHYIKDAAGETLCKVFREDGGMVAVK